MHLVIVSTSRRISECRYVAEQSRVQGLTLLGEPRIIVPVPGATNLCGICCDGVRVYCTDMDQHVVHVLRLSHNERWQEKRREAIEEVSGVARTPRLLIHEQPISPSQPQGLIGRCVARQAKRRRQLEAAGEPPTEKAQKESRTELERQRDRAVKAVLFGRTTHTMLGLHPTAGAAEVRHAVRLAMRLLHPDRSINIALKGMREYDRIEAAFKKVNNLKDDRIEAWFTGEQMPTSNAG